MFKIECPKCGSDNFNCYDTDFDIRKGIHWDLCDCMDCGASFNIRYRAEDIEFVDEDEE